MTTIRFSGLASGLDTEGIVQAMAMPYQAKVDQAKKEETLLTWQKEAWQAMNTKLYAFYDQVLSPLRLESTFTKKTITSSNNQVLDIDASSTLPEGTHTIDGVYQLAQSPMLQTAKLVARDGRAVGDETKLTDLLGQDMENPLLEAGETLSFRVSDTKDAQGNPIYQEVLVSDGAIKVIGEDGTVAMEKTGPLTVKSLEEAMQTALPKTNVHFDANAEAFFISGKTTGEEAFITFCASGQNEKAVELFGLNPEAVTDGALSVSGENALLTYNGVAIQSETNQVSVNGLTVQLKGVTDTPITILSSVDSNAIAKQVEGFVHAYNELIDYVHKQIDADPARSYEPLTEEEKALMSDYEIEAWEEKIKTGLLSGNETLEHLMSLMRRITGSAIEGNAYNALSAIGVTTSSNWQENGKLLIDTDKLKEAIANDSEAVIHLLTANGDQSQTTGIMDQLYDGLTALTKSSTLRSTYSFYDDKLLDTKLISSGETIRKREVQLYKIEERYYAQFTAMEQMLSQWNSQASFFGSW